MIDQNLKVRITGDASNLVSALKQANTKVSAFGTAMKNAGRNLSIGLTLPLAVAGGAAIKFASDFQESMNKVDVAFGNSKKQVKDFAQTTLKQFGIAEGSALDMAALFGDMATSMGLTRPAAANMSTSLVGLAGDLASFKNIGIEQATTALAGVFTGETESLKKLGIVMTEANLKQFAMEQGISSNIKTMSQAEKVALRYKFIIAKTANAQGDFGRTSDGAANQMRIFQESLKELSAKFGQVILPMFTKLVSFANGLLQKFSELSPTTKKLIIVIAGIAAALGPVLFILGTLVTLAPAIGTALTVMMGPIGLIVAGLTAIAVVIYKNWAGIKQALVDVANYFIDLYNSSIPFQLAVDALIMHFRNLLAVGKFVFSTLLTIIKLAASNIFTVFKGIGEIIMGIFTLDPEKIKQGFTNAISGIGTNISNAFDAIKTDASNLGTSVVDNFNEALKQKTIAPIVIPVQITTGGTSEDTATTDEEGGIPTKAAAVSGMSGVGAAGIQTPISDMIAADTERLPTVIAEQQEVLGNARLAALQQAAAFNERVGQIITSGLQNLASGIGAALGNAISTGGNLVNALGGLLLGTIGSIAIQLGKAAIQIGIAMKAIKLSFKNPFTAIAAGIALIAVGTMIKNTSSIVSGGGGGGGGGGRISGNIGGGSVNSGAISGGGGVTAFANGGIISGPTMSLMGEYPGAKSNPEVVSPLNKLKKLIGDRSTDGNINVTGEVRVDGQDLLIAIQRANETAERLY